jgi:hypothetical protein
MWFQFFCKSINFRLSKNSFQIHLIYKESHYIDQCGKSNEADKEEKERWGEKPSAVWDRSSTLSNAHPNPTKSTKINETRFDDFTFENYLMIESLPCTVWQEHGNVEALHLPILCT